MKPGELAGRVRGGDLDGAEADVTRVIEASTKPHQALAMRSRYRILKDNIDGSIEDLKKLAALSPAGQFAPIRLGVAYLLKGEHETALGAFEQVLASKEGSATDKDDAALLRWSARVIHGEAKDADAQLSGYFGARSDNGRISFLVGKVDLKTYLQDATGTPALATPRALCVAYFYAGERAVADGRTEDAEKLLARATETRSDAVEYPLAVRELARLRKGK